MFSNNEEQAPLSIAGLEDYPSIRIVTFSSHYDLTNPNPLHSTITPRHPHKFPTCPAEALREGGQLHFGKNYNASSARNT